MPERCVRPARLTSVEWPSTVWSVAEFVERRFALAWRNGRTDTASAATRYGHTTRRGYAARYGPTARGTACVRADWLP
jgi:hypothetical protein